MSGAEGGVAGMGRKSPRLLHSTFWYCVGRMSLSGTAILLLIKRNQKNPGSI